MKRKVTPLEADDSEAFFRSPTLSMEHIAW